MKSLVATLALTVLLAGCGHAALPGPTQKNVTQADLVGVWQYPADFDETTITLDLKADGTFVQTIQRAGQTTPQVHSGNWDVEDNTPKLMVLKPVFADASKPWVLEEANWWVVDSNQDGVPLAILGAADDRDPDSCWEFQKVR